MQKTKSKGKTEQEKRKHFFETKIIILNYLEF